MSEAPPAPEKKAPKKKKKGGAAAAPPADGDIGELKRTYTRQKQARERKKRRGASEGDTDAGTGEQQNGGESHSAAHIARCKQIEHMDVLAELVHSRIKAFSPDATVTTNAVYHLAELMRVTALQMLEATVRQCASGAGTKAAPLGHAEMLVGIRTRIPDELSKAFVYQASSELAVQQGTLEATQQAFGIYAENV